MSCPFRDECPGGVEEDRAVLRGEGFDGEKVVYDRGFREGGEGGGLSFCHLGMDTPSVDTDRVVVGSSSGGYGVSELGQGSVW